MASPLAGSLAKTINKAFSGLFFSAVLLRDTPGNGPVYNPGVAATVTYSCKALVIEWDNRARANGWVAAEDRQILVLARSLGVTPQIGDRITIQGETYTIGSEGGSQPAVTTDPAKATWTLRAKA